MRSFFDVLNQTNDWLSFQPGLERVSKALDQLNRPDRHFQAFTMGGTNGKGTVSFHLADRFGEGTGLFISPHLVNIRERISIQGKWIDDKYWQLAYGEILNKTDGNFTYFEWLFLTACVLFKMKQCKYAIFEVGMGGRLDAVNALDPTCSAITSVALDHQRFLGNTIEDIAFEKVQICRKGKPFFLPSCLLEFPKVRDTIERVSPELVLFPVTKSYSDNFTLVDAISGYFDLTLKPFRQLPGRREIMAEKYFFDTAHNEAAWLDTLKWMKNRGISQINILFGLTGKRKPKIFKKCFSPITKNIYAWGGNIVNSIPFQEYKLAGVNTVENLDDLIKEPLLICGTHSLVGIMREKILSHIGKT